MQGFPCRVRLGLSGGSGFVGPSLAIEPRRGVRDKLLVARPLVAPKRLQDRFRIRFRKRTLERLQCSTLADFARVCTPKFSE